MNTPTAAEEAQLDELYRRLKHLRADLRAEGRAYANGVRYGAHESVLAASKTAYTETAAEYNAVVEQVNALTAPYRAQRAAEQRVAAAERRAAAELQHRANLRAAACPTCGLIHPGEC